MRAVNFLGEHLNGGSPLMAQDQKTFTRYELCKFAEAYHAEQVKPREIYVNTWEEVENINGKRHPTQVAVVSEQNNASDLIQSFRCESRAAADTLAAEINT